MILPRQLPSVLASRYGQSGFLDEEWHRRWVTDGCPWDAFELDDDDWVVAFESAQGHPASWTVVGDDHITQAQVERGDGSDAERHGGGFQSSDAGRR
jgi:hypothetical protein